ncbi:MAG: SH3 domain-containing protein [Leptospiraceae bacterium]|nr:SH3 domain-containing protein [Leptospiraceae bacterium]
MSITTTNNNDWHRVGILFALIISGAFVGRCSIADKNDSATLLVVRPEAGLVLRAEASRSSARLDVVPRGSIVPLIAEGPTETILEHKGSWYQTRYNAKVGWIFGGFTWPVAEFKLEGRSFSKGTMGCDPSTYSEYSETQNFDSDAGVEERYDSAVNLGDERCAGVHFSTLSGSYIRMPDQSLQLHFTRLHSGQDLENADCEKPADTRKKINLLKQFVPVLCQAPDGSQRQALWEKNADALWVDAQAE